jgi:hypothetical protein
MVALMLAFLQDTAAASREVPRLLLEDLEGRVTEVEAKDLALSETRARGGWSIRPIGFPPLENAGQAGPVARVALEGGDELRGHVRGGEGERLRLELLAGVALSIDVSEIESLAFDLDPALEPAPEGDRLYRRTGGALDAIDGTVEGFSPEGVRFDSVLGARTFPWEEIGALFIEVLGDGEPPAPADRLPVIVDLVDGSRVRGSLVALERERCRIALHGVPEITLPLACVAEIALDDGRARYLSELVPLAEEGRGAPFGDELGMTWPHRRDENVLGEPLRSAGQTFRRGIGMHAPSRLTFGLDGAFRGLRAQVAIDDSELSNRPNARGSVVFRVLCDGRKAWESPLVRGGDAPLALPLIELAGVRELVLEVDPAGDFAGDRADWLRPVLIR